MKLIELMSAAVLAAAVSLSTAIAANIMDTAASTGKFDTLLAAAKAAGMTDTMATSGH